MTGPAALALGVAPEVDPAKVTPGFGGFLVFFVLALVAYFLYRSFTARMRRVDVRARLAAEAAEHDAAKGGARRRDGARPDEAQPDEAVPEAAQRDATRQATGGAAEPGSAAPEASGGSR